MYVRLFTDSSPSVLYFLIKFDKAQCLSSIVTTRLRYCRMCVRRSDGCGNKNGTNIDSCGKAYDYDVAVCLY